MRRGERRDNHMNLTRRLLASAPAKFGVLAAVAVVTVSVAAASSSNAASTSFTFSLQRSSAAITSCLPHARGSVTITTGSQNDLMKVSIAGMPHNRGFDLFVIQQPGAPFGVSWYQTDIQAGSNGTGSATVRGVFDVETFSVSPGGTVTFAPTHQYHLGLWFNNPNVPFNLGCEPGQPMPIVTPFNGEQHAGIQVLNTAQFPDNAGPLSHVHR
jgi:hypothetical protein